MRAFEKFRDEVIQSGVAPAIVEAALEYVMRRDRFSNPPGRFDRAGRFYATKQTASVRKSGAPSRRFPYVEMNAARTAAHCAEAFGVDTQGCLSLLPDQTRVRERDRRVWPDGQRLLPTLEPVSQAPELRSGREDVKLESPRIRKLQNLTVWAGLGRFDLLSRQHTTPLTGR